MEIREDAQLAQRFDGMAAEVRWLRSLVAALIVVMIVLGGSTVLLRPRPGRPIVAASVEIRDREGRLRGTFGVDRDGLPGLRLYDHRGSEQVTLAIPSDDTSGLYFQDQGSLRVALESSIEGTASIRLVDSDAKELATMSLAQDGTPRITVDNVGASPAIRRPSVDYVGPLPARATVDTAPLPTPPPTDRER